jgi:hypothetical protein
MKKQKFTSDYLLNVIPNQYKASIDGNNIAISTQDSYLSINSALITSIEIEQRTIKITIKKGKIYNIITLWKETLHIHNITFKI